MVAIFKDETTTFPLDEVICGDALSVLKTLPDNCVDAIVTDPPAGIEFMGKEWDSFKGDKRSKGWAVAYNGEKNDKVENNGFYTKMRPSFYNQGKKERDNFISFMTEVMTECLRVVKPGGHGFIWALPRTSHWTAYALEEAGWEVREKFYHLFGSGFPKSKNLGNGQGTATKPAVEEWILVRKPLSEKSIVANVLRWGVGGLNIDRCRVQASERPLLVRDVKDEVIQNAYGDGLNGSRAIGTTTQGRWPANLLLSHSLFCTDDECTQDCPIAEIDRQSGITSATGRRSEQSRNAIVEGTKWGVSNHQSREYPGDQGGASRYFSQFHPTPDGYAPFLYQSKASRRERNQGCEGLPEVVHGDYNNGKGFTGRTQIDGEWANTDNPRKPTTNGHPTVKPLALCKWLIKLICPPDGIVLDPFFGSGTIGVACTYERVHFIGIDQDFHYCDIARARIAYAQREM